jgi:predicted Zn-dependent peptidase
MPDEELKNVKNFLDGQEAVAMQDLGDLSQRLALSQLYGTGAQDVYGHRERLAKLTAAQIQEVAKKYLGSPNWVKTTVVPEGGK